VSAPAALPPLWAVELLDVLGRRGRLALATSAVLAVLGTLVSLVSPGLVPPRAFVGGLVGVTALAVGLALALALDALDVRVRGPRHVRSSGGELVALLPETATTFDVADLATAVRSVQAPGSTLHLGLAPVGSDTASAVSWTRALGEALADDGASVLIVDLAAGSTDTAGILEVVRDRKPLGDVVTYDDGRSLAVAGPGADRLKALQALVTFPSVLPTDVDVLLIALPQIVTRSAVNASRVLDQVLFVAEANLTSRVELMASLDALRVAGCAPQVVLIDGGTYRMLRPTTFVPERGRTTAVIPAVPLAGAAALVQAEVTSTKDDESAMMPEPAPVPAPAQEPEPEVVPAALDLAADAEAEPGPPIVPEPPFSAREPSSLLRTVDVLTAAAREQAETTLAAGLVDTVPMSRDQVIARSTPGPAAAPTPGPAAESAAEPPAPPRTMPPVAATLTLETPVATPAPAPVAAPPAAPPAAPRVAPPVVPPVVAGAHDDLTTELSSTAAAIPTWASEEDEEDLLRTTVQLSVLHEELDFRDDS
jgi:hypothetical protein